MTNRPVDPETTEHSSNVSAPRAIDARGPRFGAAITTVLLLVAVFLAAIGTSPDASGATVSERAGDPAFVLSAVIALLFVWGFTVPTSAPWAVLFRTVVKPRLGPTRDWEDPRPPRFAQFVGFAVVTIGLVLHLVGVPWALVVFGGAAFVAAFLNAAFGFCLGCEMYLGLVRLRVIRPGSPL